MVKFDAGVAVERAKGFKCKRCWTTTEDPIPIKNGPLCKRCAEVIRTDFPHFYIIITPEELYDAEREA